MLKTVGCAFAICLFLLSLISPVRAEDWPGWRGPRGDGTSLEPNVPTKWDGTTGDNVAWKVPLNAEGHASPAIWGDRIFIAGCVKETQERVLLCFDRKHGKTLWRKTILKAPLESKHSLNSFASSTPATDGKLVFASFLEVDGSTVPAPNVGKPRPITPGKMVLAAFDMQGNEKWQVRIGDFVSAHGYCSNPVLYKDLVIMNGDHDGDSYVAALKKETGEIVWKIPREHKTRSYVTPIIRNIDGRTQMVFSGSMCVVSINPDDGSQYWKIEGPTEQYVASMVFDGKLFFMAAGYPTYHVMGIRPDGRGDVTETHIAWHAKNAKCYVPSPVLAGGYLMVADDRGTANCYAADTGDRKWQERLGSHFSASLVTAGGLVYFIADDGITKIVKPGPSLEVVAENPLGEHCYSSFAISQGQIFIRGEENLLCIGKAEVATAAIK